MRLHLLIYVIFFAPSSRFCCNALPIRYKPSKTLTHGCPISQGWLINPAPKLQLVLYPRTSEVCKKFEKLEASQLGEKPLHGLPRCGSEDIDELESGLAAADTLQELGTIMQAMSPAMSAATAPKANTRTKWRYLARERDAPIYQPQGQSEAIVRCARFVGIFRP